MKKRKKKGLNVILERTKRVLRQDVDVFLLGMVRWLLALHVRWLLLVLHERWEMMKAEEGERIGKSSEQKALHQPWLRSIRP